MMKKKLLSTVIVAALLTSCSNTDTANSKVQLVEQGRYHANIFDESAAEIVTYDKTTKQTFVVNSQSGKVDILTTADIEHPQLVTSLDIASDIQNNYDLIAGPVNSVDVYNGLLAVAIEAHNKTDNGWVAFYETQELRFLKAIQVGSLPDMLTYSENGKKLVIAIEGEPSDKNYQVDPKGEVAIIDIDWQDKMLTTQLTRLNFDDFNKGASRHGELPSQLVLNGYQASVAQDLEPEYVAINADSSKAYISLQENNAIAVINLNDKSIEKIMALGFKDHLQVGNELHGNNIDKSINIKDEPTLGLEQPDSMATITINHVGNELDGNNKDKAVNIKNEPALGLYQPDSIATITINDVDYLLTANEGDDRSDWISALPQSDCEAANYYYNLKKNKCADDIKLKDAFNPKVYNPSNISSKLDLTHFQPTAKFNEAVNTIKFSHSASKQFGDLNGDGKMQRMMTFGGRSFSIWDVEKELLVFDSGSDFERITAQKYGHRFNQSNDKLKNKDRSDNKGPEPEAITVANIEGKTYAFIGLERMGGIMVYDISEPSNAQFIQYVNNRNMNINPDDNIDSNNDGIKEYNIDAGDLGPEGFKFVSAEASPTHSPILIVGNEVSGTTSFYRIDVIKQ